MFKTKQKIINIFLYVLISLEAIYIAIVYYPVYGIQGIIAGLIYSCIAVVHIYSPGKKLSNVVLAISIGIAIPRLLLTIENRIDERRREVVLFLDQEQARELPPEKPILNDCSKLPSWEGAKIKDCQEVNSKTQADYIERFEQHKRTLRDYQEQRLTIKTSIPLTLSDYGGMLMFMILSASLPMVIYLLLIESGQFTIDVESYNTRTIETDIINEAIELYNNNIPVKVILKKFNGQLSKTTFYKYLKNGVTQPKK